VRIEKFKPKIDRFYAFYCPHCDALLSTSGPY
jgi:thiol-disulfide isomerase/thioredoxin